jgi:hypothetical protein
LPAESEARNVKSPEPVILQTTFISLAGGGGTVEKKRAQKLPRPESTPTSGNPPGWKVAPGLQPGLPRLPRYTLEEGLIDVEVRPRPSKGELHEITATPTIAMHIARAITAVIHRKPCSGSRFKDAPIIPLNRETRSSVSVGLSY